MSDRTDLLRRLHRHPDDDAATAALRRLDADPALTGPRDDRASARLVSDGLSAFERLRLRWSDRTSARVDRTRTRRADS